MSRNPAQDQAMTVGMLVAVGAFGLFTLWQVLKDIRTSTGPRRRQPWDV